MVPEAVLNAPVLNRLGNLRHPAVARPRKEEDSKIGEHWMAGIVVAGLLALRILYAFVLRVDSDEPQHLHTVWAWAHGLLPYRDVFDNHSPLFQMLCAPLFGLLGEHVWIVVAMRLAMLPLYVADLWLMYLIGRKLYAERWAVWMAIVGGCIPTFFLVTGEFRTDDLWTTLWLAAVWMAVTGALDGRRAFLFGLVVGACFSVSMKTTLLMLSMGIAVLGLLALHALSRRKIEALPMLKRAGLMAAGAVVIPALLVAFFASQGALHQMYYCVVQHNVVPGLGKWAKTGFHQWLFPLSLPVLLGLGWLCMHSSAHERIGAGRALILITAGAYYFLLRSYWPLVTAQDFIPVMPLVALAGVPFLFHLVSLTRWPAAVAIPLAALALLAGELCWICKTHSPLVNRMAGFEDNLAVVLHLTDPTDFVMDGKGETIYRKRPTYWAMEGVTIARIKLGLIPNDVRAKIIQTGTCIAVDHRLRPEDQDWLQENFLEAAGKVWVAGKDLGKARTSIHFHTDIPARYSIVSEQGKLTGRIDGAALTESQELAPGDHDLEVAGGTGEVAVVWTQALDRGFDPFTRKIAGFFEAPAED